MDPYKFFKHCFIYKIKDCYKISSLSKTEPGYYIENPFVKLLPLDVSLEDIFQAIWDALNHSKHMKDDIPEISKKELLSLFKEKSFLHLYKNCTACQVRLHDIGKIQIVPHRLKKNYLEGVSTDQVFIDYSEDNLSGNDHLKIAEIVKDMLEVSYPPLTK